MLVLATFLFLALVAGAIWLLMSPMFVWLGNLVIKTFKIITNDDKYTK